MTKRFALRAIALGLFVLGAAISGFCQQEKGDSELGLSGSLTIPHSSSTSDFSGGGTTGQVSVTYGYYFTKHDLIGVDNVTVISKDSQIVGLQGRYRHLIPTKNPRVFPFFGADAGLDLFHSSAVTDHVFLGTGEAGIKFFLSQRSAFEVAYNLQYINIPDASFGQRSSSVITFGFTHIFGGKH